jgi:3-hydroxyacyl-CoA dehydrogenase/enoyl-CoA hydratase/3-hydroxybutyryl-CoA epimerase
MTQEQTYKHWRLEIDEGQRGWLHLDKADSGANVLSAEVLGELKRVLAELPESRMKGLVILSDKSSGFIAGADVTEFKAIKDSEEAIGMIRLGQSIFDELEELPFPTVALIAGYCLGGGLELALACRYRVALDDPKTRIGLPEIKLGIHPGFGGTMRLVRLIGAPVAMDLMLTGRTVESRMAAKLGIVDHAVPERHLKAAAASLIDNPPAPRRPGFFSRFTSLGLLRPQVANYLRKYVAGHARPEHYPAPYALIDLWEKHGGDPRRMLDEEAHSVARLVTTETARNLLRVFFLQERLKSLGRHRDFQPRRVHVIGAGVMGGDIAAWSALQGFEVTLQDRAPQYVAPALKRAAELFSKRLKDRRLVRAAQDRLLPDVKGLGLSHADVVIEAIIEDVAAKEALYRVIEPQLKPDAILATNTSSIPLETLGEALAQPGRLVGIHFFNPVAKMQLVEIISTATTDKDSLAKATTFVRAIDRLPLPVKSAPGFLVNRILMPYLLEAMTMLDEGVSVESIDRAAREFGMPVGPLELADAVGLDICLHVGEILAERIGQSVPERLRTLVAEKRLGMKSGQGFYEYQKGEPKREKKTPETAPSGEITDRLILPILNESVACLREGVVEDADLLDAGMVFGTGFAPFRGGPLHFVRGKKEKMTERLREFEGKYGARFVPDPGWAKAGQ